MNAGQALTSAEAKGLFTGEMAGWSVPSIGTLSKSPDALVAITAGEAVARVQAHEPGGRVKDVYLYLRDDGGWKLYALRTLAMTEMMESLQAALVKKAQLTAQEKRQLANLNLTLASDSVLRRYWREHRPDFEALRHAGAAGGPAAALLRRLHLSDKHRTSNGTEYMIGGVLDNTVGFLCSPTDRPPAINPSGYIWVEKLADRWYLFRTT